MHIHKFADLAQFDEVGIGGTLSATERTGNSLKNSIPPKC